MTYQPTPQKERGGQQEAWTADEEVRELLRQILEELKKVTLQLSLITDQE